MRNEFTTTKITKFEILRGVRPKTFLVTNWIGYLVFNNLDYHPSGSPAEVY